MNTTTAATTKETKETEGKKEAKEKESGNGNAKLVVLVDMDGVLADFGRGVLDIIWEHPYFKQRYPSVFALFEAALVHQDPQAIEAIDNTYKRTPHFFQYLKPMQGALFKEPQEGALNILDYLQDVCGYEVFICSSPSVNNRDCASDKALWIERHFGNRWVRRLILTKDKTLVHGDILIDDRFAVTGVKEPAWKHLLFVEQTYAFANDVVRTKKSTAANYVLGFEPAEHVPQMIAQTIAGTVDDPFGLNK